MIYGIYKTLIDPGFEIHCYMDGIEVTISNGISTKWWNNSTQKWQLTEPLYYQNKIYVRQLDAEIIVSRRHGTWFRKTKYTTIDKSVISDSWITAIMYIPLSELAASNVDLLSGEIGVKILKSKCYRCCSFISTCIKYCN